MRRLVLLTVLHAALGCSSNNDPDQAPLLSVPSQSERPAASEARSAPAAVGPDVMPLVDEARRLLEARNTGAALAQLNEALRINPACGEAYRYRAAVHHQSGLHDLALSDLNAAIEHLPHDEKLLNNRGFVLLAKQQFSAALRDFAAALAIKPDYPTAYNNRGLTRIAMGDHRGAIPEFDRAIALDPGYVDAWNNRGFARMNAGDADGALTDLNEAIRLNPRYVNSINNRALVNFRSGFYAKAVADFTEAMMLDPHNPKYYQHRSEAYLKLDDPVSAKADQDKIAWLVQLQRLTAAVTAAPRDAAVYVARAAYLAESQNESGTLADYDRAIELDPRIGLVGRAGYWIKTGRADRAIDDCNRALEIDPELKSALSCRGDARVKKGEFAAALADYELARRFDADVADVHRRYAEVLEAAGDTTRAAEVTARGEEILRALSAQDQPTQAAATVRQFD